MLLLLLLLLRPKLTYTLQKKVRVQVKSRSSLEVRSGWMSVYEDQAPALVRIVIDEVWSAVFPICTLLEIHRLLIRTRSTTARDNSLAPLDVQVVELERVLIPLPFEENRPPRVSSASFSSHQDGREL